VKPQAPPELLEEMFEIQEALAEAKTGGDLGPAVRTTLRRRRDRLLERLREEEARLTGPLSTTWDAAGEPGRRTLLEAFKQGLAARAYLRAVIDDLGQALGEEEGTGEHVTHHRD
ncbi:MAG: hypothetical protein HY614_00500, partial [Candidatus Rokubacteria bacterium]|nr:hypothetical protein [Candidatus Rokubacteria bacterium]